MMAVDVEKRRRWVKAALIPAIGILLLLAALPWILQGNGGGNSDANVPNPPVTAKIWTLKVAADQFNGTDPAIDAAVVGLGVNRQSELDPPRNPQQVGWWDQSARPEQKFGQTIITGHTVHTGGGQFDHLHDLKVGAIIVLESPTKTFYYRVTQAPRDIPKGEVDKRAAELFGQSRPHNRLVLITCDDWNGHSYETNTFVWADPIRVADTAPAA
jgi:LPXTG-site transpeptidase (sortase) family protein